MRYLITNKKYQKIKIFLNDGVITLESKETKDVNTNGISDHMKNLSENDLIKIKKVER